MTEEITAILNMKIEPFIKETEQITTIQITEDGVSDLNLMLFWLSS